jgi:cytochrome c-type biogenesis protein CcmE
MTNSKALKIIITGVLALGAAGFLVYSSFDNSSLYEHVDVVAAKPSAYADKDLKLHGIVLAGSIKASKAADGRHVREFVLERNGHKIPVRYTGYTAPDNLDDNAEVVAQGRLAVDPVHFESTELMAKCPSKYQGANSNRDLL